MAITKEEAKELLESLYEQVAEGCEENKNDGYWYTDVIYELDIDEEDEDEDEENEDLTLEDILAKDAAKYPALHPLMRKIVKKITAFNQKSNEPINCDGEWSGGAYLAGRVAVATKQPEDIMLFAKHLETRDLDHECDNEFTDIKFVIEELGGFIPATFPILIALYYAESQHRAEFLMIEEYDQLEACLREGDNLNVFLKQVAEWHKDYLGDKNGDKDNLSCLEEMFELFLCEVMGIDDQKSEECALLFIDLLKKKAVPTVKDFESLK